MEQNLQSCRIENIPVPLKNRKFQLDITTVNVGIRAEKKGVSIEFDIHIAHAQPVVINQSDDNLDAAIDLAIDRASKALRRLHTKVIEKQTADITPICFRKNSRNWEFPGNVCQNS